MEQEKRLKRLESHTKREQQQRITSGSKLKIIQDQMKLLSDRLESNAGYERDQRMLFQALQQQLTELGDRFEQLEQSLKEVWRSTQAASVVNADPRIPWWLDKYTPPKDLIPHATPVSETQASFVHRNGYSSQLFSRQSAVIFERTGNGSRWIIKDHAEQSWDYRIPSKSIKLNSYEQRSMPAYFEWNVSEWNHNCEYRVLYPSTVSVLPQGIYWELIEKGRLKFIL